MRLDKFLASMQFGSRKEVKMMLHHGRVQIDGTIVKDESLHLEPAKHQILVDGESIPYYEQVTLMLHKPVGYLSANEDPRHPVVTSLLHSPWNRYTFHIAGRLDLDSEGMMILTTDGELVHELIAPKKMHYKTYRVTCDEVLQDLSSLEQGVEIRDGNEQPFVTLPAKVRILSDHQAEIAIREGKFHQVKRMFASIGYTVNRLERIAIGNLSLDPLLAPGEYKVLTEIEIQELKS
ncbi:MAG: pseudouridine synthase [Candidatus Izemoplasmatales bacterium]